MLFGVNFDDLGVFHITYFRETIVLGIVLFSLCFIYRRRSWIIPVWTVLILVCGLHTLILGHAFFAGLEGFAAMGLMYLLLFSLPVTITFLALLFVYPKPRKTKKIAEQAAAPDG